MNRSAVFRINAPAVVSEVVDGEAVMIHLDSGCYFSTRDAGTLIWGAVADGMGFGGIVERLAARYSASRDEIEAATACFLEQLRAAALVVADSDAPEPAAGEVGRGGGTEPFAAPALEVYDDMKELLQADPVHDFVDGGWPGPAGSTRRG